MKKTLVISLLFLLFINQLGYYCIHLLKLNQLKGAVKQQLLTSLSSTALERIDAIANKDLIKWEEPGKEFYLKGQLYDVARIVSEGGSRYLYCFNDKNEEQLLTDLSQQIRSAHDAPITGKSGSHEIKLRLPDLVKISDDAREITPAGIPFEYARFADDIVFPAKDVDTPPSESIYS